MTAEEILKEARSRLEAVYGERLRGVVLYGSFARGTQGPDSDIDLLVLLTGPVRLADDMLTSIRALYPLGEHLGRPISPKPIDIEQYEHSDCPLFRNAKREGIAA